MTGPEALRKARSAVELARAVKASSIRLDPDTLEVLLAWYDATDEARGRGMREAVGMLDAVPAVVNIIHALERTGP